MVMKFTNNAASTLASSILSSATSLTVVTGQGALFPSLGAGDYFYCTLANTAGTVEIVKVTARATDVFTIVRAQDNTTAANWSLGDKVELRLVAASLNDIPKLDEANTFSGANTFSADTSFTSTGAVQISKGTSGQQPGSPVTGMLRYNTTNNQFEGYSGSSPAWNSVGGATVSNDTSTSSNLYPLFASATSGLATTVYTSNAKLLYKPSTGELSVNVPVASNGIFVNNKTIGTSYTIASGYNGQSVGPVTISSGVAITVSSGQRWLVL